jgi:hypothetical protein
MELMLDIKLGKLPKPISYPDKIMLVGSCFTEHIGNSLANFKFPVLQNPNGILFDPSSVCRSLVSYIENKQYQPEELFQLNEVWNSWHHHSRFSNIDPKECLEDINVSQTNAHEFLKQANWIIITLGSAFSYRLTDPVKSGAASSLGDQAAVANCHRAPAQWFKKHLLEIEEISAMLDNCYHRLMQFNSQLNIIFTVSPVRHIRDGVVDNNRSKARLIESIHHMVNKFDRLHYFPAYEIVIDVLRDYRFFDIDLVHPNYSATDFVLNKFTEACISHESQILMEEIKKINIARKHRAFQPRTNAHRQFLASHYERVKELKQQYPFLDLAGELAYFSKEN